MVLLGQGKYFHMLNVLLPSHFHMHQKMKDEVHQQIEGCGHVIFCQFISVSMPMLSLPSS